MTKKTIFFLPLSIIDHSQASIVPGYFSEVGEQKQQCLQVQKKTHFKPPAVPWQTAAPSEQAHSPGSTWSWGRGRWAPHRRAGPAAPSCGSGLSNSSPWTGRRLLGSSSPLARRSTLAPRRWPSRRSAGGVRPGGAHSAEAYYEEVRESVRFSVGLNQASSINTFVMEHDPMLSKVNSNLKQQQENTYLLGNKKIAFHKSKEATGKRDAKISGGFAFVVHSRKPVLCLRNGPLTLTMGVLSFSSSQTPLCSDRKTYWPIFTTE